jgi:hypothetical protein
MIPSILYKALLAIPFPVTKTHCFPLPVDGPEQFDTRSLEIHNRILTISIGNIWPDGNIKFCYAKPQSKMSLKGRGLLEKGWVSSFVSCSEINITHTKQKLWTDAETAYGTPGFISKMKFVEGSKSLRSLHSQIV